MNKRIILTALLATCLLLTSCGSTPSEETGSATNVAFKTEAMTLLPGETVQLEYEVQNNASVTFSTTDENVLLVDANGRVSAISSGTATVIASVSEYEKAYLPITVALDVMQSRLSACFQSDAVKLIPQMQYQLLLTVQKNGQKIENANIVWSSSDEAVATVADGYIQAITPGETIVSATITTDDETAVAYCIISVYEHYQVQLEEQCVEASIGKEFTLNAKVYDAQGNPVLVKDGEFEYFTSNPQAIAINNGKFKVIGTGIASAGVRYMGNVASIPVNIFSVTADFFKATAKDFYGEVEGETFSGVVFQTASYQPFFYLSESGAERIQEYADNNGYTTLRMHTYAILKNNSFRINGRYVGRERWTTTDVPISEIDENFWLRSESEGTTEVYMWFEFR